MRLTFVLLKSLQHFIPFLVHLASHLELRFPLSFKYVTQIPSTTAEVKMSVRPQVLHPTTYGCPPNAWVEHPSGLVDLAPNSAKSIEFSVLGDRRVRLDPIKTALVVVDMQK